MEFEKPPVELACPTRIEVFAKVEISSYEAVLLTMSLYPARVPIKILFLEFVASRPASEPINTACPALTAPAPALLPKKFEKDAASAPLPASRPMKFEACA